MTMLQQIATKWTERQAALGLKGKAADRAVFEFFIGAATAFELADHPSACHVRQCAAHALAITPFPLAMVARWARGEGVPGQ